MTFLIFGIIIVMALRCISYGIFTMKRKNIAGGVATIVLALLSVVAGSAVFY